jgi:hypothetical protein
MGLQDDLLNVPHCFRHPTCTNAEIRYSEIFENSRLTKVLVDATGLVMAQSVVLEEVIFPTELERKKLYNIPAIVKNPLNLGNGVDGIGSKNAIVKLPRQTSYFLAMPTREGDIVEEDEIVPWLVRRPLMSEPFINPSDFQKLLKDIEFWL